MTKSQLKQQSLVFTSANYVLLVGWFIIFFLPNWEMGENIILYGVFVIMTLAYAYFLYQSFKNPVRSEHGKPSFFTKRGVLAIMENSNGALACWMHLIVFDLIIAYYIRTQGAEMVLAIGGYCLVCY